MPERSGGQARVFGLLERSTTPRADRKREQQVVDLEERRAILEEEVVRTPNREQQRRQVELALAALRRQVEAAQAAELARALEYLERLDEHDREAVRWYGQRMVDQMFLQLGRLVHQVIAQDPPEAVQELLIQLLSGADASPEQEASTKATPAPRPSTRNAPQRKLH